MNKERREILHKAVSLINDSIIKIRYACDSEQDAMDNVPENMQGSERYCSMENSVDHLEDAEKYLEDAIDSINYAINS